MWKISSVGWGFNSIKIDYSDYPKSLIRRINKVYVFNKISLWRYFIEKEHNLHSSRLFGCNQTCYCVNMASVTSASRSITSASRYHPSNQSRSSMYIRGLIPGNFAELAEAVPIASSMLKDVALAFHSFSKVPTINGLLSSAHNFCKPFGPRSGPTN